MSANGAAVANAAADEDDEEGSAARPGPELSDWGLFQRTVTTVREESGIYKEVSYDIGGRPVRFRKPVDGEGCNLMHGDFARKLSPSEEALAMYITKHPKLFERKRVLDIGAGLGFAGFLLAICASPSYLELTDGDPEVVRTLKASALLNQDHLDTQKVKVKKVLWDNKREWAERGSFDVAVAADVVYLEQFHVALMSMVAHVLRPGCTFILVASKRNGSLDKFIASARGIFCSVKVSDDYDPDVMKAIKRSAKCFPIMVRMTASEEVTMPANVAQLCQASREKREEEQREEERQRQLMEREKKHRQAYNDSLVARRRRRLQEEERLAEAEAAAAAAADAAKAAEAAAEAAAAPQQSKTPPPLQTKTDNRSDWGMFSRCSTQVVGEDGEPVKEMSFESEGRSVVLQRPLNPVSGSESARRTTPAMEALAAYVRNQRRCFKGMRVLEIGAGLGLAGLTVAVWTKAKRVELTDWDANGAALLQRNIALNEDSFTAKKVTCRSLELGKDCKRPFDWIIGADVLQPSTNTGSALLSTMRRLLKPTGTALLISSVRGSQLDSFVREATMFFDHAEATRHYDAEISTAFHGKSCFPMLIRLRRVVNRSAPASAPSPSAIAPSRASVKITGTSEASSSASTRRRAESVPAAALRVDALRVGASPSTRAAFGTGSAAKPPRLPSRQRGRSCSPGIEVKSPRHIDGDRVSCVNFCGDVTVEDGSQAEEDEEDKDDESEAEEEEEEEEEGEEAAEQGEESGDERDREVARCPPRASGDFDDKQRIDRCTQSHSTSSTGFRSTSISPIEFATAFDSEGVGRPPLLEDCLPNMAHGKNNSVILSNQQCIRASTQAASLTPRAPQEPQQPPPQHVPLPPQYPSQQIPQSRGISGDLSIAGFGVRLSRAASKPLHQGTQPPLMVAGVTLPPTMLGRSSLPPRPIGRSGSMPARAQLDIAAVGGSSHIANTPQNCEYGSGNEASNYRCVGTEPFTTANSPAAEFDWHRSAMPTPASLLMMQCGKACGNLDGAGVVCGSQLPPAVIARIRSGKRSISRRRPDGLRAERFT
eukprot:TRINITY_DN24217_c0_g2_i1.p1 TRINITY_DN24217_c0_g2~~TRINITY_DN24217_c0_g2_i1.p1  ORF type:complete len:1054 (-),score=191.55 TRINITY_DN24217_c0_g2_i1:100-3261(-)